MSRHFNLMVALNGARKTKRDHPALPITPAELAVTAQQCFAAGADAIHLHVRDNDDRHSLDPGRYREAMAAINQAAPDMAIQITTESAGVFGVADQLACVTALRPAAASISVREMARDGELAARMYGVAQDAGTRVQHILYGQSCLAQLMHWRDTGVVRPGQNDVIVVLGSYTPARDAAPSDLFGFLDTIAETDLTWTACAFGKDEHACLLHALGRGGDVRTGFENSISCGDQVHSDNAASVASFVHAAGAHGYVPARLATTQHLKVKG